MKKYLFLVSIFMLLNGCATNQNHDYLDRNEAVKNSNNSNLYKLNINKDDEYDTLTVLVTNNIIEDYDSIKYFKRITQLTGKNNLATHMSYGIANKRYNETMKLLNNCSDINPSNIPLVIFYIKQDKTCIKFNYKSKNEFISILDFTYTQLKQKQINKKDISKFQFKQIIRDYAYTINLSPTLLDGVELLVDKIYEHL